MIGPPFTVTATSEFTLIDLSHLIPDLRIVLDAPKWFMREGGLALNLFIGDLRLLSLAFSFYEAGRAIVPFIGALQGRDVPNALDYYRDITKAAHGMRPRDLVIEIFRMICSRLGIAEFQAVSDEFRHHRHDFFRTSAAKSGSINYDEAWTERGGIRAAETHYSFQVSAKRRDLATLPSKKRAMYRRRYEMLDLLQSRIDLALSSTVARDVSASSSSRSSVRQRP
jgi:uncharacterized protein VirK/YbjX